MAEGANVRGLSATYGEGRPSWREPHPDATTSKALLFATFLVVQASSPSTEWIAGKTGSRRAGARQDSMFCSPRPFTPIAPAARCSAVIAT